MVFSDIPNTDYSDRTSSLIPADETFSSDIISSPLSLERELKSEPQSLRIEAEEMSLENYRIETVDAASNQLVASFLSGNDNESGSASTKFSGPSGSYDVLLGYFDEQEGTAQLDPLLNGQSLGQIKLDQQLGSNLATSQTQVRRTIAENVSIKTGDTFEVFGVEFAGEPARLDYVEFVPTGSEDNSRKADSKKSDSALSLRQGAQVRYIKPNGKGNGSSWNQAASLDRLDQLLDKSKPGDEVWIAGDLGSYNVEDKLFLIRHGGSAEAPIYVRGVSSKTGEDDRAVFVGDRAENWKPGKNDGDEVFRLADGADHLSFSNLGFKNVGNGAFRLGADLTDITLEDMEADNVRRFVENFAAGGERDASVSDLTIRNVDVSGFSKAAIRLQYNTRDVLIEDVTGDSEQQYGDNFATGVQLEGSVHDVMHRRVTMKNAIQQKGKSDYWNGDGFATEENVYNITYEDTYAAGNADGGYDLKSNNTVLRRAAADNNKRNFRIWGSAKMYDVTSINPNSIGGTGTTAHVHVLGNGDLVIEGGRFENNERKSIIFDLDEKGSARVEDVVVLGDRYQLKTVQAGNLQLNNLTED